MGVDPITASVVGAGVMGGLGIADAARGNKTAKRSLQSAWVSAQVQAKQTALAGALSREQAIDEGQKVLGALRVAAGTAGVADFYAAEQQAVLDAERNAKIESYNAAARQAGIRSEYEAAAVQIKSRYRSPLLAGLTGGLGGAQVGLNLN
jgi:hypothetical protein